MSGKYAPKISALQLALLVMSSRIAVMTVFLPVIWAKGDPKNAWIAAILAGTGGVFITWIATVLAEKHPDHSFIQIIQKLLGKWLGRVLSFIFLWFFLHIASITTRQFADILETALMPETPIPVFIIYITIAVIFSVNRGLEAIAKVAAIATPFSIVSLLFISVLNKQYFEINALLPVLEDGWSGVIYSSIIPLAWFGEVVIILMVHPYVRDKHLVKPYCLLSVVVSTILLVIMAIIVVAVFGADEASQLTLPLFAYVRLIEVADFFERIEAILVAVWISLLFSKICIYLYVGVIGVGQWLNLTVTRPLILPMAASPIIYAYVSFESIAEMKQYLTPEHFGYYALVLETAIPLLLLLLSYLHPRGRTSS
ncbi:GerAB/ArcD/ProY family transporter [Brevibacillus sp. SYSU BS000544]|uniref:GerAB/ArcD/ProY family transporter n=1 Tax=Brevibacillus sp. SYSU BS000544 TaxID=3416443 RepID=UPI003CE46E3D